MNERPGPRVLVARPDHLGDLLVTLPAIRALRRRLRGVHIACLVPPPMTPLAERATDIDEVLVMPFGIADPVPLRGSAAVRAAAAPLRGRFDLAILPRPNDPWSGALVAAARIPVRAGHPEPGTLPFLTHPFPERASRHVACEAVVLALRAASLLGRVRPAARDSGRVVLRLLPEDDAAAHRVLADAGVVGVAPVVVHPAAGWPLKTWSVKRWSAVVSELGARLASPVLVVGQAAHRSLLDEIVDGAHGHARAVHDVSLGGLAALHARARLVVGIDSGALHLATLAGTPVVGLFGPFDPMRFGPVAPAAPARSLWRSLPCSPCGTLEAPPCGATHEPACLLAISARDVVEAAIEVAAGSRRAER